MHPPPTDSLQPDHGQCEVFWSNDLEDVDLATLVPAPVCVLPPEKLGTGQQRGAGTYLLQRLYCSHSGVSPHLRSSCEVEPACCRCWPPHDWDVLLDSVRQPSSNWASSQQPVLTPLDSCTTGRGQHGAARASGRCKRRRCKHRAGSLCPAQPRHLLHLTSALTLHRAAT